MPRLAAALLGALAAAAALAAPAPLPRPWVSGWEKPVDPRGDCKFERAGDRLTITVPGEGHDLDAKEARLNAPRLLRDVEGDFVAVVRVGGTFRPTGSEGYHEAGLLLTDGRSFFLVGLVVTAEQTWSLEGPAQFARSFGMASPKDRTDCHDTTPPSKRPSYIRLERQGETVGHAFSEDGKEWSSRALLGWKLPRKVKVGVFAESTAPGKFRAQFDHFQLSRPGR